MYLFFAVLGIILLVYYVPIYPTIIVGFFYLLWYFDGKEYTGERRWDAFRSLRVWQWISPVEHVFPLKTDMSQTSGKKLIVFSNTMTPSTLMWSMGLHGGGTQFGSRAVHYVVPPVFMWIPFVRDILMWSGAVTYSLHNASRSKHAIMTSLLEHGRVVAYVPSMFHVHTDLEEATQNIYPDDTMLEYIVKEQAQLVPVFVQREQERYHIVTENSKLRWLQSVSYNFLDFPFPMCYWYKLYHPTKPHPIVVNFGPIMSGQVYNDVDSLLRAFKEQMDRMDQPILMESNKSTKGS